MGKLHLPNSFQKKHFWVTPFFVVEKHHWLTVKYDFGKLSNSQSLPTYRIHVPYINCILNPLYWPYFNDFGFILWTRYCSIICMFLFHKSDICIECISIFFIFMIFSRNTKLPNFVNFLKLSQRKRYKFNFHKQSVIWKVYIKLRKFSRQVLLIKCF